jgi:hypothetical protein
MARILYFIGAGLTKALASPTRPVPAMFDFISTSADYIDDDVILTTLAELENSEPYPYAWVSAEARSLALQLVGRNRTSDPAVRIEFARALRERPGESIEDLLDRTGSDASNMSSQSADVRFRYAIRRLFTIIGWDVEWSPLISFLKRQFEQSGSTHTFVSFNYDLVLERGIQLAADGKMDFTHGYGFPITLQVTGNPPPSMVGGGAFSGLPVTELPVRPADLGLTVLKPHGSLNWLVPTGGHESKDHALRQGRTVIIPLCEDGALRYLPTTDLPPWVQLPNELPVSVEPVILTPRGAKKPDRQFLHATREQEEKAILESDEVYVLGWSIPRTDTDQECLIRSAAEKRDQSFQCVTVVNHFAGVDYYRRVQDIFGVERGALRTYNAGFRDFAASKSVAGTIDCENRTVL